MVTDQAAPSRSVSALLAAVPAVVGVLVSLVVAIVQYAGIDGTTITALHGIDSFLQLPSVAVSLVIFSLFVAFFMGLASGAEYHPGLWIAAIVAAAVGAAFQLVAVITDFSWFAVVLVLAAIANGLFAVVGSRTNRLAHGAPQVSQSDRPIAFGVVLVVAGIAGLLAAYNLSVDKVTVILFPSTALNCNVSILVQCGKNLGTWQGSLFGFPNPLIGLGGFAVVVMVGIAVLTGARFPRWWWVAFNLGVIGAFAFVVFLQYSSIFAIQTLCLWCALVWTVTIPLFWVTTLRNVKVGNIRLGAGATRFATAAYSWTPVISLLGYLVIFLLYETRLNLLARL